MVTSHQSLSSASYTALVYLSGDCLFHGPAFQVSFVVPTQKEKISQTDLYLVILSSKTYVFEDEMTKY